MDNKRTFHYGSTRYIYNGGNVIYIHKPGLQPKPLHIYQAESMSVERMAICLDRFALSQDA